MHKQQNNQAYELSSNNSRLTLPDGTIYELNIERAMLDFFDSFPKDVQLKDIHDKLGMIKKYLTKNLPDDAHVPTYKNMQSQLTAYTGFFGGLFCKVNE